MDINCSVNIMKTYGTNMNKLTGAALDRAVANTMGLKSVHNCEEWGEHMNRIEEDDDTQVYKKAWVGLTDEERMRVLQFIDPKTVRLPPGFKKFAESIEQLLKEKNT